jgi:(p)ppGpp synthase/HD superfamily hydrolase
MSTLERAIAIAAEAHTGVVDKAGAPYILHPLRVMLGVSMLDERMVAVLHDVVEDTPWNFGRLRAEGFSETVIAGLDSVTKRTGEDYEAFVRRAASNPIGRRVKLADLTDNLDLSRIANPTEKDFTRMEKYRRAVAYIKGLG